MVQPMTRRAPGKFRSPDGAVVLSLISFAVLMASLALPRGGLPGIDTCAFHALTGLSCPGCGLTRAFCAISHGQFHDAWSFHPFSFPLYAGVLAGAAAPLLDRRFPALSGENAAKALRAAVLMMAAAMLLYGGWRAKGEFQTARAPSTAKIHAAVAP